MKLEYGSWEYATPAALALIFIGAVSGREVFLASASIPGALLLLSALSRSPEKDELELERSVSDEAPAPGQEVRVTLKARNTGDTTMTDLRVVDSVPDGLKIVEGAPRASFALTPGKEKELLYTVAARRGSYAFGDVPFEYRGSGPEAYGYEKEADGDEEIECKTEVQEIALRNKTDTQVGDLVTSKAGSGLEFHSLRDYQNSDPMSRVEWRRLAKDGELATKNFREERSAKIVMLVDAREVSDRKAEKGLPTGVDLSSYAATRVYLSLLRTRHQPGVVALGVEPEQLRHSADSPDMGYISPGRGRRKRQKILDTLTDLQKADKTSESALSSRLHRLLPPGSQVVMFTPLLDDDLISTVKVLDQHGFPSTVVSPDVTRASSAGARLESVRRDLRLEEARKWAPVVDWDVTEPMSMQVSKALRKVYGRDI